MSGTNRTLPGLLIGAVCGLVIGGLTLALPVFFEDPSYTGLMGSGRDWVPIFLIIGGLFGSVHGLVAGAVIGMVNASKILALMIGAAAALPFAFYLLVNSGGDREVQLLAALCLPIGALIGLLTSLGLGLKRNNDKPPV